MEGRLPDFSFTAVPLMVRRFVLDSVRDVRSEKNRARQYVPNFPSGLEEGKGIKIFINSDVRNIDSVGAGLSGEYW